jgi:hypothetical protein
MEAYGMRYDRESWRKLYRSEPLEQKAWSFLTRCLRDHLIRYPDDDDGTLLPKTSDPVADLGRVLGLSADESTDVSAAVSGLLADGYLCHDKRSGRLYIKNFRDAQQSRSRDAQRKAEKRAKEKEEKARLKLEEEAGHVPDGSADESGTFPTEEKRREEKRREAAEEAAPAAEVRDKIPCPPDLRLTEAQQVNAKMGLGLDDETIGEITVKYVGLYLGRPGEIRTIEAWRSGLNSAVCKDGPGVRQARRERADREHRNGSRDAEIA